MTHASPLLSRLHSMLCATTVAAGSFSLLLPAGLLLADVEWDGLSQHAWFGLSEPVNYWRWALTVGDGLAIALAAAWGVAILAAISAGFLRSRSVRHH